MDPGVSAFHAPVDPRIGPEAGCTAGDQIRRTVCLTLTIALVWAQPPRHGDETGALLPSHCNHGVHEGPRRCTEFSGAAAWQPHRRGRSGSTGDPGASREAQYWLSPRPYDGNSSGRQPRAWKTGISCDRGAARRGRWLAPWFESAGAASIGAQPDGGPEPVPGLVPGSHHDDEGPVRRLQRIGYFSTGPAHPQDDRADLATYPPARPRLCR
jgi:hypothetical protein